MDIHENDLGTPSVTYSSASKPISVYEHTNIIGIRAEQLVRGAPILVSMESFTSFDPYKIAEEELTQGKLPFIVSRTFPDGKTELVRLSY
jgi:DNA-directed RNA polymerase subunit K/omega